MSDAKRITIELAEDDFQLVYDGLKAGVAGLVGQLHLATQNTVDGKLPTVVRHLLGPYLCYVGDADLPEAMAALQARTTRLLAILDSFSSALQADTAPEYRNPMHYSAVRF